MGDRSPPVRPGVAVVRLGDVGSTNDEAMARLRGGSGDVWVVAERQLAGRGRRGRPWISETGNLYASFAFSSSLGATALGLLPLAAATALADAIEAATGLKPAHKWPNDVLIGDAKTAGILIETEFLADSAPSGGRPSVPDRVPAPSCRAVVGFGVNIAHHPGSDGTDDATNDAINSLAGIDPPAGAVGAAAPSGQRSAVRIVDNEPSGLSIRATHLATHDPHASVDTIFDALREALGRTLERLAEPDGVAALRERWLARAAGLGKPITVRFEAEVRHGTFAGLDDAGRLLLAAADGTLTLVSAGDVFIRTRR